ncbi:MAG: hypothetical protein WCC59_16200 [Terriglobales bacterium]
MKRAGVLSTAILFLLLGTTAPAYAQQEQHGKEQGKSQPGQQHQQAKPAQQPHPQQAGKPAPQPHQQQAGKPAQQPHQQPAQQQRQQQAKRPQPQERPQSSYGSAYHGGVQPSGRTYGGVHHSGVPQQKGQVRSGFLESRAKSWDHDHHTWAQRGGYNGYRIPEDRFRAYWGREHYFHIYSLPMVFVGGYPRFRYDGYWVTFVDPWPEMWPATWYETDDVYLDYTDDGYYLYDRTRPGPGIAVTISF